MRPLPIALLFITIGVLHFVRADFFLAIVPPWVPQRDLAVSLSGVAEIAGGAGLLIPATRRLAAYGLLLLLVVVFPANVYMLQQAIARDAQRWWQLALWLRLPLQFVLMWWIWSAALRTRKKGVSSMSNPP